MPADRGWALTLAPKRLISMGIAIGGEVIVELAPERPQRGDLADGIAAALGSHLPRQVSRSITRTTRGPRCGNGAPHTPLAPRLAPGHVAVVVRGCSIGAACPGNGGQEDVSTRPGGSSARYRR